MNVQSRVRPFLMFEGNAEEAMTFYVSLFPGSEVTEVARYRAGGPGKEGSIMRAAFTLAGQPVLCTDSFVHHGFTFTPAISFFVECETEAEVRSLAETLAGGGKIFMPLDNYGFSRLFTWVGDRFGVSWQLNLAA
ncbi:MAG TPA: VOC family protein [Bryobacteraceae bacterium]|nr:VOC family protein [Bryobacteraceae bacterium]